MELIRDSDGLRCTLVGPHFQRIDSELAVDTFCDDSVFRTAVWRLQELPSTELELLLVKVDGVEDAFSHVQGPWRWWTCDQTDLECVCDP